MTKPVLQKFDDQTMRVIHGANVWIVPGTWTELHEIAQDEAEG